jgi:hypothetical protein
VALMPRGMRCCSPWNALAASVLGHSLLHGWRGRVSRSALTGRPSPLRSAPLFAQGLLMQLMDLVLSHTTDKEYQALFPSLQEMCSKYVRPELWWLLPGTCRSCLSMCCSGFV